jgi:hypothetical protein
LIAGAHLLGNAGIDALVETDGDAAAAAGDHIDGWNAVP